MCQLTKHASWLCRGTVDSGHCQCDTDHNDGSNDDISWQALIMNADQFGRNRSSIRPKPTNRVMPKLKKKLGTQHRKCSPSRTFAFSFDIFASAPRLYGSVQYIEKNWGYSLKMAGSWWCGVRHQVNNTKWHTRVAFGLLNFAFKYTNCDRMVSKLYWPFKN